MIFSKNDLQGTDYNWAVEGHGYNYQGQPSRRSFDRYNGDQVLFIINYCASVSGGLTLDGARNIERRICNDLPLEAKSEISVFNWIQENTLQLSQA